MRTFALVSLLSSALLLACTDAGKCKRGDADCACTKEGSCNSSSLRCGPEGTCIARSPSAGTGGGAGTGGPPLDDCSGGDFETACASLCETLCEMQELMCVSSRCAPGDCDLDVCDQACPNDNVACLVQACEAASDAECETFGKPDGNDVFQSFCLERDPVCIPDAEAGCSDVCGFNSENTGGDLVDNGTCDDSLTEMNDTFPCIRGTDCSDCGEARPCSVATEACERNGDCCGHQEGESFCVEGLNQCLIVCSETKPCPNGEECRGIQNSSAAVCLP
jgi:hypothetical protein